MEHKILSLIAELKNPILDFISVLMARLGTGGAIFIIVGILFLLFRKTRKMGLHILLSLLISLVIGNMLLKPLIGRTRPYVDIGREILVSPLKDGSFPSGHTYSAFATAFSARVYNKKIGLILLIFAVLMAFTRLYLYVHYPSDVLGGFVLGYICSKLAGLIVDKIKI